MDRDFLDVGGTASRYIISMLLDRSEGFVVCPMGGGFTHKNLRSGDVNRYPLANDGFVRLSDIDGDRFLSAAHLWETGCVRFEIRRFADPAASLWSLNVYLDRQEMAGDPALASDAPRYHVNMFEGDKSAGRLIEIAPDFKSATLHDLPWYGDGYDLGYQGLVDAMAFPGSSRVLISVQRSSTVVVHDLLTGRQGGAFNLAGRAGNPELSIVENELWTIDYDTFVRVELNTFRVVAKLLLQTSEEGTMQFAGSMHFIPGEGKIAVARPFSGDVVIVDPKKCAIEHAIPIGVQPIECVVTSAGRIIAREWKTGEWSEGKATFPKSFWRFW